MAAKKNTDPNQQFSPILVAPLGELKAYTVHEHELDIIAAGSPSTLAFNFAISLISIGISLIVTLTTTTIHSDRLFYGYLIFTIISMLASIFLFALWFYTRSSTRLTVKQIKSRLKVTTVVQEPLPPEIFSRDDTTT